MDIRGMEQFLKQIKSVISCKFVIDNNDNLQELHILSDTSRSPKQLSRDIQSALISKFGLDVDHKKISIAQIDEKSMDDKDFRLKLKSIEFSTNGTKADVKVILEKEDQIFQGEVSGPNTLHNSKRLIASATLKAVEKFLGIEENFLVEDIKITDLASREVVVTAITFVTQTTEQIFSGCAFINRDDKEAVVKSTLDAINRRIIRHYNGE